MQEDSKKKISKIKIDGQTFDIEIDMQNATINDYPDNLSITRVVTDMATLNQQDILELK